MKNTMKKLIVLTLIAISLFALAVPASAATMTDDGFKYVPTKIVVRGTTVTVEGYFDNFNNYAVGNFDDFTLYIYQDGEYVLEASFGDLDYFKMKAWGSHKYTFTIYNAYGLNSGTYYCSSSGITADFDCSYTYWR